MATCHHRWSLLCHGNSQYLESKILYRLRPKPIEDAYYDDMDKLNDSPDTSTSNGSVWMIVLMHRWVIKQYYDPSLPVVMTYAKPQTVPQVNRQRKMLRWIGFGGWNDYAVDEIFEGGQNKAGRRPCFWQCSKRSVNMWWLQSIED